MTEKYPVIHSIEEALRAPEGNIWPGGDLPRIDIYPDEKNEPQVYELYCKMRQKATNESVNIASVAIETAIWHDIADNLLDAFAVVFDADKRGQVTYLDIQRNEVEACISYQEFMVENKDYVAQYCCSNEAGRVMLDWHFDVFGQDLGKFLMIERFNTNSEGEVQAITTLIADVSDTLDPFKNAFLELTLSVGNGPLNSASSIQDVLLSVVPGYTPGHDEYGE